MDSSNLLPLSVLPLSKLISPLEEMLMPSSSDKKAVPKTLSIAAPVPCLSISLSGTYPALI